MNNVVFALIFGIVSCAFGNDYCQERNVSTHERIPMFIDIDSLIYGEQLCHTDDKMIWFEATHFKNLDLPILCRKVMKDLKRPKMLILENVNFRGIGKNAFTLMDSLMYLAIVRNKIEKYNVKIDNLRGLSMLVLKENQIKDIEPEQFTNLPNLQVLQLSQNNISEIRHWFNNCKSLGEIRLDNNKITKIPSDAFINLTPDLQVNIMINHNNLEEIENGALDHLQQIGRLELGYNKLAQLPDDFLNKLLKGNLLDLRFNLLRCIPTHLLNKFKYIDLKGNPLSKACIPTKEDAQKLHNVTLIY